MHKEVAKMIRSGLVSVTFRKLTPKEIVDLMVKAGLEAIEWGGDVHVPHGELDTAREVRRITEDAGLVVASYGSYYRVGEDEGEGPSFQSVLDTAVELGTSLIRVWAGKRGSTDVDDAYRKLIEDESRRIADMASEKNISIAYEYHEKTLTDTNESAVGLLKEVGHKSMGCYWQPRTGVPEEVSLKGLEEIFPWLSNIHVFHWTADPVEHRPLSEGVDVWKRYFAKIAEAAEDRYAMIEFVPGGTPEMFLKDAETLKQLLEEANRN